MKDKTENIDLDAEIPVPNEDTADWTPDERRMVILAAEAIAADERLSMQEQLDFLIALIMKPLNRSLS